MVGFCTYYGAMVSPMVTPGTFIPNDVTNTVMKRLFASPPVDETSAKPPTMANPPYQIPWTDNMSCSGLHMHHTWPFVEVSSGLS
jgi:hypothetical protein